MESSCFVAAGDDAYNEGRCCLLIELCAANIQSYCIIL